MNEQWQELKETIIELRDNNGTGTQQEVCKFLANYMDTLEKQITDEWIPCSERLPEENDNYFVTISFDIGGKEPVREVYKDFFSASSQKWLYHGEEVIAWMPLPKPYKAESKIEQVATYADQDTLISAT